MLSSSDFSCAQVSSGLRLTRVVFAVVFPAGAAVVEAGRWVEVDVTLLPVELVPAAWWVELVFAYAAFVVAFAALAVVPVG